MALNDHVILLLVVWVGDLGRAAWRQLISVPRMVMAEVTDWGQRIQDGFTHMSGTSVGYAGWDLAESPSLSPSPLSPSLHNFLSSSRGLSSQIIGLP